MKNTTNQFKITMNDSNELLLNRYFICIPRPNMGYYAPCDQFGRKANKKTGLNKPLIIADVKEAKEVTEEIVKAEVVRLEYKEVLFTVKL